jgi:hypothetical protein
VRVSPTGARRRAYLVAKELRVGDIVLISSAKLPYNGYWPSYLIRPLTFSRYSHASLMVTRLGMLETNGPGHTSQITVPDLRLHDGRLLMDVEAPRALVLRPTAKALAASGGQQTFRRNVATSSLAYLGREYSAEVDLISASVLRPLRFLLPKSKSLLRRWSCSGLVAEAYADAGLDIVKGDVARAAPGTFARSSFLEPVPGAVLTLRTDDDGVPASGPHPPSRVVSGALSLKNAEPIIDAAVANARRSSFVAAAKQLDSALRILLRAPLQPFGAQLRFEESLRKRKLL